MDIQLHAAWLFIKLAAIIIFLPSSGDGFVTCHLANLLVVSSTVRHTTIHCRAWTCDQPTRVIGIWPAVEEKGENIGNVRPWARLTTA